MTGKWGSPAERLERHYIPEPNSGCWLWLGATNSRGYGGLRIDGRTYSAHRASYEIYHRCKLDRSISVCHRCDNPACVNPDHLFLASHQDNMIDRGVKGRSRGPIGEANPNTRITAQQAAAIKSDTRPLRKIADEYGLSISGVHGIRSGATWKHLNGGVS